MVKEDWAPYQHPQTGPRPRRFLLRSFSTSGPHRLYLLAARPTFYSNLLVSTCSLLYLPSHFVQLLFLSFALSFSLRHPPSLLPPRGGPPRPHAGHIRGPERVGLDVPFTAATKRAAQASADLPGSHFRLGGNVHPRHTQPHLRHGVVRAFIDFADRRGFKFSDGDRKSRAQESRSRAFYGFLRSLTSEATISLRAGLLSRLLLFTSRCRFRERFRESWSLY